MNSSETYLFPLANSDIIDGVVRPRHQTLKSEIPKFKNTSTDRGIHQPIEAEYENTHNHTHTHNAISLVCLAISLCHTSIAQPIEAHYENTHTITHAAISRNISFYIYIYIVSVYSVWPAWSPRGAAGSQRGADRQAGPASLITLYCLITSLRTWDN